MQVKRILWLYGYDVVAVDLRDGAQRSERTVVSVDEEDDDAALGELSNAYGRLGYAVQTAALVDKVRLSVDLPSLFERGRKMRADAPTKKDIPEKEE